MRESPGGMFPIQPQSYAEGERLSVIDMFDAIVRETPTSVAVIEQDSVVSYEELDRQIGILARHFRAQGALPHSTVGVMMARSRDLIASMMALWKLGVTILPIDANTPVARARALIDVATPIFVVVARRTSSDPEFLGVPLVYSTVMETAPSFDAPVTLTADHVAVCAFTSGSTGEPKGVLIPHRALSRAMRSTPTQVGQGDVFPLKSAMTFVDAIGEVLTPLTCGAAILVIDHETAGNVERLLSSCIANNVTYLNCVPSLLSALCEFDVLCRAWKSLRHVEVSGEMFHRELAIRAARLLPQATIVNSFGCSEYWEATIETASAAEVDGNLSVGYPVEGTIVLIVDENGAELPIGTRGEVAVAGEAIAYGYLGDPIRTADRFLPLPNNSMPGARMYRTGDMGMLTGDGKLVIAGRVDDQVKIRGHRVECAEVEAVLHKLESVRAAAVVPQRNLGLGDALSAYLVAHGESKPDLRQLTSAMQALAPAYMVPHKWFWVDVLPMNASGKVDRRELACMKSEPITAEDEQLVSDAIEAKIVDTMIEVLGLPKVSPSSDFFKLGGDSLLAVRLVNKLAAEGLSRISVTQLFQSASARSLTSLVRQAAKRGELTAAGLGFRDFAMSDAQVFFWRSFLADRSDRYDPVCLLRISGDIDVEALSASLRLVVSRNEVFQCSVVENELGPMLHRPDQHIAVDVRIMSSLLDESTSTALHHSRLFCEHHLSELIDPTVSLAPLICFASASPRDHFLGLKASHMVMDGISLSLFFEQVRAAYLTFTGRQVRLDLPPKDAFLRRAEKQREVWSHLNADSTKRLASWRNYLGTDVSESWRIWHKHAAQDNGVSSTTFELDGELTIRLLQFASSNGKPLFSIFLAALGALLIEDSARDRFVVATALANRGDADAEGLIGNLVNVLPVVVDVRPEISWSELLSACAESLAFVLQNQDLPAQAIERHVFASQKQSISGIADALLVLERGGEVAAALASDGYTVEELEVGRLVADYPLTLRVVLDDDCEGRPSLTITLVAPYSSAAHFAGWRSGLIDRLDRITSSPDLIVRPALGQSVLEVSSASVGESASIWEKFEDIARRLPEVSALEAEGRTVIYRQLLEDSKRKASALVAAGVEAGSRVAVLMPKDGSLVAWMLACWCLGAAVVLIDSDEPIERVRQSIAESESGVLLTDKQRFPTLDGSGLSCTVLETASVLSAPCDSPFSARSSLMPQDLAAIVFTSGTMGAPKCVGLHYAGLMNCMRALSRHYDLGPGCRVAWNAAIKFDSAVAEPLLALLSGATLIVPGNGVVLVGSELERFVFDSRISHLIITPTVLETADPERFPRNLTIALVGEPLSSSTVARWSEGRTLYNAYGPSEGSICVTISEILNADDPVTVGFPLPGAEIAILDDRLRPLPNYAVGEVAIRGVAVSCGYLNDAAATAENFVPDNQGRRLYLTGDFGFMDAEGRLTLKGRRGDQVKINGQRVDIGDVERALNDSGLVLKAAAVRQAGLDGQARLAAYAVPAAGRRRPWLEELRQSVARSVPLHMVPTRWYWVDTMPTTMSGKLDRNSLVSSQGKEIERRGAVAAVDDLERSIASLVADVLGLEEVGRFDDFFALGGSSLDAIRLIERLRACQYANTTLNHLLRAPTVEGIAKMVRAAEFQRAPPIAPQPIEPSLAPRTNYSPLIRCPSFPTAVFLTGATGFLGSAILEYLLRHTSAHIVCTVRSANIIKEMDRLTARMRAAGIWDHSWRSRIKVTELDLQLNIDEKSPAALALRSSDLVIHCGANVNLVYDYDALRQENVSATVRLLELSAFGPPKFFLFVSTRTVADKDESTGYGQSKVQAEKEVLSAFDRGLSGVIVRPGRITGHTVRSAANSYDFVVRFLGFCLAIGSYPRNLGAFWGTPVDVVARQIVVATDGNIASGNLIIDVPDDEEVILDEVFGYIEGIVPEFCSAELESWGKLACLEQKPETERAFPDVLDIIRNHWADIVSLFVHTPVHSAPAFRARQTASLANFVIEQDAKRELEGSKR